MTRSLVRMFPPMARPRSQRAHPKQAAGWSGAILCRRGVRRRAVVARSGRAGRTAPVRILHNSTAQAHRAPPPGILLSWHAPARLARAAERGVQSPRLGHQVAIRGDDLLLLDRLGRWCEPVLAQAADLEVLDGTVGGLEPEALADPGGGAALGDRGWSRAWACSYLAACRLVDRGGDFPAREDARYRREHAVPQST